ncbi:MAG: hypothetical protein AB7N71_08320 [Phycisphaerae bacterium]
MSVRSRRKQNRKQVEPGFNYTFAATHPVAGEIGTSALYHVAQFGTYFDPSGTTGSFAIADNCAFASGASQVSLQNTSAPWCGHFEMEFQGARLAPAHHAEAPAQNKESTQDKNDSAEEESLVSIDMPDKQERGVKDAAHQKMESNMSESKIRNDEHSVESGLTFEMQRPKRRFNEVPEPEPSAIAKRQSGLPRLQFQAAALPEVRASAPEPPTQHAARSVANDAAPRDRKIDGGTEAKKGFGTWLRKKKK